MFTAAGQASLGWLVVVAINTVASLFYYQRWIAPALRRPEPTTSPLATAQPWASIAALAAAAVSIVLGPLAGLVLSAADNPLLACDRRYVCGDVTADQAVNWGTLRVIPDVPQMCTVLACSHHQPTKGTECPQHEIAVIDGTGTGTSTPAPTTGRCR